MRWGPASVAAQTIGACVDEQLDVMVVSGTAATHARFDEVRAGAVALTLYDGDAARFSHATQVCATFQLRGRTGTFLGKVRALELCAGRRPRLWLAVPSIVVVESRATPRIDVPAETELHARAQTGERTHRPRVLDLSLGGARLVFDDADDPGWSCGTMLRLTLGLELDNATSVAVVVWGGQGLYGVAFRELSRGDGERLRRIFAAVEAQAEAASPGRAAG